MASLAASVLAYIATNSESNSFPCLSPKDEPRAKENYLLIKSDPPHSTRLIGGSGFRSYFFYKSALGVVYVISTFLDEIVEWKLLLDDVVWFQIRIKNLHLI